MIAVPQVTAQRVWVDASLVLRTLLPDERDQVSDLLWQDWGRQALQVIGPALLYAEATSSIRLYVTTGRLTAEEGEAVFAAFNSLRIQRIDRDDLHLRAWELARRFNLRRAYDMIYFALAQLEGVDLWTADLRLANALDGREPRLRVLGR